jgi:hypothetical protein
MYSKWGDEYRLCSKGPTIIEGARNYNLNTLAEDNVMSIISYSPNDDILQRFEDEYTKVADSISEIKKTQKDLSLLENKVLAPEHDYIPGVKETALSDIQQLQEHQRNVYFFSVLGGMSLIIFSIMISNQI